MFNLFKKKKMETPNPRPLTPEEKEKNKKSIINHIICTFAGTFRNKVEYETPELSDEKIREMIEGYFSKNTLTEAYRYLYDEVEKLYPYNSDKIDWRLDREEMKKTPEYQEWKRNSDIRDVFHYTYRNIEMDEYWVDANGKAHTSEEAARIAADKWCELIFGWHLQDNGAINEDHPGGFSACALGTILADKCKEGITEDVKKKVHDLFYGYYYHFLHYEDTHDNADINWLVENLPDDDEKDPFDWKYFGFRCELYCDYGPSTPLYLILVNAGVDGRSAGNICPWKTGIEIRPVDNAVMYRTYQHCDEL